MGRKDRKPSLTRFRIVGLSVLIVLAMLGVAFLAGSLHRPPSAPAEPEVASQPDARKSAPSPDPAGQVRITATMVADRVQVSGPTTTPPPFPSPDSTNPAIVDADLGRSVVPVSDPTNAPSPAPSRVRTKATDLIPRTSRHEHDRPPVSRERDNKPSASIEQDDRLPFFGVAGMRHITNEYGLLQAQQAGVAALRHGKIAWKEVEPVRTKPPTYRWEVLEALERELINAEQTGIDVTLLVMFTPDWAQAVPGHSCGRIREDKLEAFAQFLGAAVERYSRPPHNVKYWELFNEPDVDPSLVPPESGFGCWGDQDDEHYGGGHYARMLEHAYPAIKRADPQATVILGGLLLDKPDVRSSAFLAGVLEGGGGDYFDMLAFHAYAYYNPEIYDWDTVADSKWTEWGGIVAGKTAFLRETLSSYDYAKPLLLNEAGLAWWPPEEASNAYRLAQADYVVKLYARGLALDLANVSWFGWRGPGWHQMALLNRDLSPTPAYHAFTFASDCLAGGNCLATGNGISGVAYIGPTNYPGIEGYAFQLEGNVLQVVWSADGKEHGVSIPSTRFLQASDLTGQPLSHEQHASSHSDPAHVILSVRRPVYVELSP